MSNDPTIRPGRRVRHRAIATGTVVAAAALALAACSSGAGGGSQGKGGGGGLKPLRLGTSSSTVSAYSAAYAIGQYLGCYKQQGYNMTLQQMNTPQLLLSAIHNGAIDIGLPGSDQFVNMVHTTQTSNEDLQLKAIYEYTYPSKRGLGVEPNSSITSFKQLAGKKVGVDVLSDSSVPFLKVLLKQQGVDPSSVKYLAVGKGIAPGVALQTGKVDALYIDDNQTGQLLQAGRQLRFVTIDGQRPYVNASGIVGIMSQKAMTTDPGKAKAFARCTAEGTVFAKTNPTAAAYIMLKMFPSLAPPGLSLEKQIASVELPIKIRQPLLQDKDASVPFGQMDTELFQNDETLVDGLKTGTVDVSKIYTNDAISYANNFDKNAIIKQANDYKVPGITGQVATVDLPANTP